MIDIEKILQLSIEKHNKSYAKVRKILYQNGVDILIGVKNLSSDKLESLLMDSFIDIDAIMNCLTHEDFYSKKKDKLMKQISLIQPSGTSEYKKIDLKSYLKFIHDHYEKIHQSLFLSAKNQIEDFDNQIKDPAKKKRVMDELHTSIYHRCFQYNYNLLLLFKFSSVWAITIHKNFENSPITEAYVSYEALFEEYELWLYKEYHISRLEKITINLVNYHLAQIEKRCRNQTRSKQLIDLKILRFCIKLQEKKFTTAKEYYMAVSNKYHIDSDLMKKWVERKKKHYPANKRISSYKILHNMTINEAKVWLGNCKKGKLSEFNENITISNILSSFSQ